MELFKIGDKDLTNNILVPTYKINSQPSYYEWTDANYTKHRDIRRRVIQGTFTIKFVKQEDYFDFITLLENNTGTDGSTPVSIYVNNLNKVSDTTVFITIDPENTLPLYGTRKYEGFQVSIEER